MDAVSDYFAVQRWGVYLPNAQQLAEFEVVDVSEAFVERYEQVGRSIQFGTMF